MPASRPQVIELLPEHGVVRQLFVLLHSGVRSASSMLPFAVLLRHHFPDSALLLPEGFEPDAEPVRTGRWFPPSDLDEGAPAGRLAAQVGHLGAFVHGAQERFGVRPADTAVAGFSQGAVVALECSRMHDGLAGRLLAFSGRYASLPQQAPSFGTLHLFHGDEDPVVPLALINETYAHLVRQQADATLDVAAGVGHVLHPALVARAIHRLQTGMSMRNWKNAH